MRETYFEPDWWNLSRERSRRRPDAKAMFSSEPPAEPAETGWQRRELDSLGSTELARGRRIPVRGESPRRERVPNEPPPAERWEQDAAVDTAPAANTGTAPSNERAEREAPPSDDLGELKQQARVARAELDATRRRLEREAEKQREAIRAGVLAELLPVLDDLERSLGAATGKADESLVSGLGLVRNGFEKVLGKFGAERIVTEGEPFDPSVHEALGVMPVADPALDGRVVKEWLPGYRLGRRVLRPAQVMVGKR